MKSLKFIFIFTITLSLSCKRKINLSQGKTFPVVVEKVSNLIILKKNGIPYDTIIPKNIVLKNNRSIRVEIKHTKRSIFHPFF